ncbi:hypothetical protein BGZ65_003394 [Modicella reniformis]|uniref:J domain-containing protein n=1 Tax=Modicella reniformis TaxID=1440133 RepID=A0A9P6J664_9FUNG|nr:hypothetical protein BGZ65_003394 [Modicella reniformis]
MGNNSQNQPTRAVDRRFSTTAFTVPGYTISQSHGVVRGLTVRTPNVGKAIFGAFASLGGGESSTYIEMAEKARETAFVRLLEHAAAVGGNAVIGVQFTGQEVAEEMTEVMAYGTAVTLIPAQQSSPLQPAYGAPQIIAFGGFQGGKRLHIFNSVMENPYQDRSLPEEPSVDQANGGKESDGYHQNDLNDLQNLTQKDYYALLNVSNTATKEDIQEAYDRLCEVFHPDKHDDPALKEAAESKLRVIRKAFEVLSSPQLRTTYDKYGEDGLSGKWEVGHRVQTPQEMMDEFGRLVKEQKQMELENIVRSRNDIIINLDASRSPPQFGLPKKKDRITRVVDSLSRTEIAQLYMKNSFKTQFGSRTQVILGSNMTSQSGIGSGTVMGTVQHTFSNRLFMEFGTSLLNPGASVIKATYNIDPDTYVSGTAFTKHFQGPTPLVMTAGRRIAKDRHDLSSMSLGVRSLGTQDNYRAELQAGVVQSYLLADRTWNVDETSRIRIGTKYSNLAGLSASIGGDRRITEYTKLGLAVELALSGGVALNVRLARLGQSVTIPILLSSDFSTKFAFWAGLAPLCALAILDFGVIKPRGRRQRAEKLRELRKIHGEFIAEQRKEAEESIRLLRDTTGRKMKQEQDKDGLVIVEASYGNLNAGIVANVTVAVQALVNNSQLAMPGGHSKTHILGFYDPCLGEKKQLRIRYEFQKRLHEVVVADMDHVVLPARSHLITS